VRGLLQRDSEPSSFAWSPLGRREKQNKFSQWRDARQKIRDVAVFAVSSSCNEPRAVDCDGAVTKAWNPAVSTAAASPPSIAPVDLGIYGSVTLR